jgi:hypothetical protein
MTRTRTEAHAALEQAGWHGAQLEYWAPRAAANAEVFSALTKPMASSEAHEIVAGLIRDRKRRSRALPARSPQRPAPEQTKPRTRTVTRAEYARILDERRWRAEAKARGLTLNQYAVARCAELVDRPENSL